MNGLLANKAAIVYGGGGALGGAIARVFGREGARVHLAGRTRTKLDSVARDIQSSGGSAEVTQLDVFDEGAVSAHADAVAKAHGRIDVMLNAIGITHVQGKSFAETTLAEYEQPITATVRAQFITAQAVVRHMSGGGVILSLTTPGGRIAGKGFLANGVFSATTEAFSRLLAAELGGQGVRTVCLRPNAIPDALALSHSAEVFGSVAQRVGTTVHEMLEEYGRKNTLLGRLPRLAEVAEYAAFAASDRGGAMTGAIANLTCGSMVD